MPSLAQEAFPMPRVAKSLSAACPCCGERARNIPVFQAVLDFCAANELMNKTGVETISGAHGIDNINDRWKSRKLLVAAARHRPLRPSLDH